MESHPVYCDVSLPVPIDRAFTYLLPETLRHRVRVGSRVLVPFGTRRMAGIVLRTRDETPASEPREVLRLLDEEPALDEELLKLGSWIAGYYCSPLGEVLRAMTPLAGDLRRGKIVSLTKSGRDAARQLHLNDENPADPATEILRLLDVRAVSAAYLTKKVQKAAVVLRSLEKKGFVELEDVAAERDPLRASAARLRAEFVRRPGIEKLAKAERELLSYLELHPGSHNVAELDRSVAKASVAARALAKRDLIQLTLEGVAAPQFPFRAPHELNPHQQAAFDRIAAALEAKQFQTFLLQGVTGSGKTEVYLKAIDAALALDRGALMLVPEIGLTPAVAGQFHHRFEGRVAILHSGIHDSERAQEWRRIRSGEAKVVVATRSGVFAPVRNLGLIIVDEEHDQSYKQQETPRYHGRDVAIVRARDRDAVVVLGSATPSLESRYNADRGKYELLRLPERVASRPMPTVKVIDTRQEFLETRKQATFSRALIDAVTERLENGEQSMLLLNRRGFSSFMTCRACGERLECPNCSVTMTFHRRDRRMLCHYCNFSSRVPERCPKCDSDHIQFLGLGSERVEDELHGAFPRARIARIDRDTTGGKRDYEAILAKFRAGEFDILVGTQMIAKGHDIPNVTLVGIVSADTGLGLPDFRAAERTFQLLTQAAGRAGRGTTPGIVLMQTINPDHYAIRFAAEQDYEKFYAKELEFRRLMHYPPFGALANVIVRGTREEDTLARAAALGRLLNPAGEGVKILGPAAASLARLKNEYRYQMLIKTSGRKRLNEILGQVRRFAAAEKWNPASLMIDVDPMTIL
ncbi:MAG TPA: primosomal protein N' [Bryobacteraceae bacterium]|nr:primosomal protein N' [Bryobacteraceae bacterium]